MKGLVAWSCECGSRECPDCNKEGTDLGNANEKSGVAFRESMGQMDGCTVKSEDLTDKQYKERDKTNQDQGSVF